MTRSKRNRSYSTTSGSNMPGNKHRPKHNGAQVAASPSSKKKKGNKSTKETTAEDQTPLQEFFAGFPSFAYDKNESVSSEFRRLCDQFGWEREDPERDEAFEDYKKALSVQFNSIYGINENGLPEWKKLCEVIGINPVPMTMKACREAVRNAHVNLVDLVDQPNTGAEINIFSSEQDLSEYTRSTGKVFPRDEAYAGGLLRYLLRHIMRPRRGGAGI